MRILVGRHAQFRIHTHVVQVNIMCMLDAGQPEVDVHTEVRLTTRCITQQTKTISAQLPSLAQLRHLGGSSNDQHQNQEGLAAGPEAQLPVISPGHTQGIRHSAPARSRSRSAAGPPPVPPWKNLQEVRVDDMAGISSIPAYAAPLPPVSNAVRRQFCMRYHNISAPENILKRCHAQVHNGHTRDTHRWLLKTC